MSSTQRLQVSLLRAPDDSAVFGKDYQAELRQFKQHMEAAGFAVSPTLAFFDSPGTDGGLTGQFLLSWAPTAVSILSTVSVVAVTWMNGKAGRKLRLKVGDVELEANSQAEIDHLVAQALALKTQLAELDAGR
ncbi:MAG: AhpC-TSA domain-containing protein [Pseudomonas fragi]|jgi:ABC-type protease/lipase transport system fused ATPase/permease subunit